MARFRRIEGTITRVEPSRDFIDGTYCRVVEFTSWDGQSYQMQKVFFTRKLSYILKQGIFGTFYFWNLHCYAFLRDGEVIEDIEGARASYFQRDARLLLLMAASIILLPAVVFVSLRKLLLGGRQAQMRAFLSR